MESNPMKIKAYLKPSCVWSRGVRAIMQKYNLLYTDLDIVNNSDLYEEMTKKSGQPLSPCVEINGVMLADVSGDEVENYLLTNNLVNPTDEEAVAPTNKGCSDKEHGGGDSHPVSFK